MTFEINDSNREDVLDRYIDSTIAHLDFMEIRDLLRDCLYEEKRNYSDRELYDEILSRRQSIIDDVFYKPFHRRLESVS